MLRQLIKVSPSVAGKRSFYKAHSRDARFLMEEVHGYDKHFESMAGKCESITLADSMEIIEQAAKYAEEVASPLFQVGDVEGCKHLGPNEVKTPTGFKNAYDIFVEGGWPGLSFPMKYGGSDLPYSLNVITGEIMSTPNFPLSMYPGLSKGGVVTLLNYASQELKDTYLPDAVMGKIGITMALTEAACGSDLGQVSTKAVLDPSDPKKTTYRVSGNKIFISSGCHDLTENIGHVVLARTPNDRVGTKGLSLIFVPRYIKDEKTGENVFNNVTVGRVEEKMGSKANPACELNFEESKGWIIGKEFKGMSQMFAYINTSRLGCAIQAVGGAELASQLSMSYAQERRAMRSLTGVKSPNAPADLLVEHPDIRRMLLFQSAIAMGGRSMVYDVAKCNDKMYYAQLSGDELNAKKYDDTLGFQTPILKGFLTEVALEAANYGIQIFGGHGYIKSNKVEQVVRDLRISSVWEGTTGIQSLDLLGRKVLLQKLKPINVNTTNMIKEVWKIRNTTNSELKPHATTLIKLLTMWRLKTYQIAFMATRNADIIGSSSVDYLMYSGYITMGVHWLKMADKAFDALKRTDLTQDDRDFYEYKLQVADFYFNRVLPRTTTIGKTMVSNPSNLMNLASDKFRLY